MLFYENEPLQLPTSCCKLCNKPIATTLWHHVFFECNNLKCIDDSIMWGAFCDLIAANLQGLAIYTCFPLFATK